MRTLRLFERTGRTLLRLAPPRFRETWEEDVVATLRDTCLQGHRAHGWSGLVFAGMIELTNVGCAAVRERLGRTNPVTSGGSRPPVDDRHRGGARLMHLVANDIRLAFRSLASSKAVAAVAVLTLALGIGVNAAVFSILDSTVFQPMPFANADRYDELWNYDLQSKFSYPGFRRALFNEWRNQTDLYDRVEGYGIVSFVHDAPEGADMLTGAFVTPGLMSMLGTPPLAGRVLVEGDGRGGTSDRVVLSEDFWRERFGAAPSAVGSTLSLNGRAYTIVGVMPQAFRFPTGGIRFWAPFDTVAPPSGAGVMPRSIVAFARRVPGASAEAVAEQVLQRGERLAIAAGITSKASAKVGPGQHGVDPRTERSLMVLGGAVAFLLLIVCANLANLSLSRSLTRARDFAVRAALGASRGDLVRESLVEHCIIGVLGAGLGLLVAETVIEMTLVRLPAGMATRTMNAIDLDGRTLLFTIAVGFLATILFGLPPAWLASRAGVAETLKSHSRSSTGSRASKRVRGALVVAEVTLAIVLLVGAALMARSFVRLQSVDRGFDSNGLVALRVGLPSAGYTDVRARDEFTEALVSHVGRVRGVRGATSGAVPPDSSQINFGELEFADRPGEKTAELVLPIYKIWPNYFDVVGIPIEAGRPFEPGEPADSTIVSASFASKYFPAGAVGRQFRYEGAKTWRTIVGVAGEVRQFELEDRSGSFEFYDPLMQPMAAPSAPAEASPGNAIVDYRTVVVRADEPGAILTTLREAVHDVDMHVVTWRVDVVDRLYADAVAQPRLILLLMSVFAAMGLVLAAAGLYGVLSYLVAQRRREIGIRIALGARRSSVGRLVIGNGLKLTGAGLVLGTAAALALVQVMQSLLYEVEPSDPASVIGVIGVLLVTAILASWWPARRAMQVDPVTLLREE